jgi:hypothetical protein
VLGEHLAGGCELDAAADPLDELHARLALERRELLRDRGRRQPQRIGYGCDAAAVCELAEHAQPRDVEDEVLGHRRDYR